MQLRSLFGRFFALVVLGAVALAGCGGDDGPTNGGPTTGSIQVTAATTGPAADPDGYSVTLDGASPQTVQSNGSVTFEDVTAGSHAVALDPATIAADCTVTPGPSQTVIVAAGNTPTAVRFDVSCTGPVGNMGRLVFDSERLGGADEVFIINANGTNLLTLTATNGFNSQPALSPSGTEIAFSSNRHDPTSTAGDIYVLNTDGTGTPRRLTTDPTNDGSPTWSADGTMIAFTTERDGNREIYVMSAVNGAGQTNITNNGATESFPSWSPAGNQVLFDSNRGGNRDIYITNADGSGNTQRLTTDGSTESAPDWSPDGSQIAFTTNRDGNNEVYKMTAAGMSPVNLSNNPASDTNPSWSPDGLQIGFTSERDGNPEVYVMNASDGMGIRNVTNNPADDAAVDWGP